jgi:hypothetical protein
MRTCHQPENIHGDDVPQTYIRLWVRMCVLTKYDIIGFNPPSHHCQTGSISPFLAKYESTARSIQFADPVYIKITLAILNTVCIYIWVLIKIRVSGAASTIDQPRTNLRIHRHY